MNDEQNCYIIHILLVELHMCCFQVENSTASQTEEESGPLFSDLILYKVGNGINKYYLPIVAVVGSIGNTLSLMVVLQKHNRRISCCVYMAFLAVSDQCMMAYAWYYWVDSVPAPRVHSDYECRAAAWMFQFFSNYSIYLILFMTLDRCIAVRFPLKALVICTPKRARNISIIILVVMLL